MRRKPFAPLNPTWATADKTDKLGHKDILPTIGIGDGDQGVIVNHFLD